MRAYYLSMILFSISCFATVYLFSKERSIEPSITAVIRCENHRFPKERVDNISCKITIFEQIQCFCVYKNKKTKELRTLEVYEK